MASANPAVRPRERIVVPPDVAADMLDAPPAPQALHELAEPWRPYRTRACLYLWRSLENEPVA